MVSAENKLLVNRELDIFTARFATCLVISDFSGDTLDSRRQRQVLAELTHTPETGVSKAALEVHETGGYLEAISTIESESMAEALQRFSNELLHGFVQVNKDLECLGLIEAYMTDELTLQIDRQDDPSRRISHADYLVEAVPMYDQLDIMGDFAHTDPARIFSEARQAFI